MAVFVLVSRWGPQIIASAVFAGLLLPELATTFRPYVGHFVVVMLTVSLLRVDLAAFLNRIRHPLSSIGAAAWITVALPLAVLSAAVLAGPPLAGPAALAVLFLFSAPPPIVSAPAFAMLIGLDGPLVLAVMLLATVLMPITAPAIAVLFVAETLPVSGVDLAVRLALMIAIGFAAAGLLRRALGPARLAAGKPVLDTISVTIAVLFAIGAMDGVAHRLATETAYTVLAMTGAFAFTLAQMGLTYVAFRPFVGRDAVAIAYAAANRNAGLVVAALGPTAVSDTIWLFFALSQLPVFFMPLLLKPLGRRLAAPVLTRSSP